MRRFSLAALISLSLGLAFAAGCNGGGGSAAAPTPTPSPSATETIPIPTPSPTPLRGPAGTISLLDESDIDSAVTDIGGLQGGIFAATFEDLSMDGGTYLYGIGAAGECTIIRYDAMHLSHPTLDAGTIIVADTSSGMGLLKTVGPCTYQGGNGYLCISNVANNVAATAADLANPPADESDYMFATEDFSTESLVGAKMLVNGFGNFAYNSGYTPFPIVGQPSSKELVVANIVADGQTGDTGAGINLTIINAIGMVPFAGSAADFLGGSGGVVRVTKSASSVWPAIDTSLPTLGDGLVLDNGSASPTTFPTLAAAAQTWSCGGAGGNCGGDAPTSGVKLMRVVGRVSRESHEGLTPYQMPLQPPGSDYLDFECTALAADSVTMPQAAVQTVLDWAAGSSPRVEIQVQRVAMTSLTNGSDTARVLVGHALVGHTDFP